MYRAVWTLVAAVALVLAISGDVQACPLETGLNCPDSQTCVSNMMFCPCPAGRGKEATYDAVSREVTGFACTAAAIDTCPDSGYLCPDGATCVNHPTDCPCPASHPVRCWEVEDQIFTCHPGGFACPDTCAAGEFGADCDPCPDCGVHGACNEGRAGDGTCSCDAGWAGATCTACEDGFFGILCTECTVSCGAHGACDDGKNGGGGCACDAGWAGDTCNTCDDGFFGAACTACPACPGSTTCDDGPAGSGECVCAAGHFGAQCTACPDCGVHGTCNDGASGDGTCTCDTGFASAGFCVDCEAGRFGAACDGTCPDCGANGACDEGVDGDGACVCTGNFDGALCTECKAGHFGAQCTACPACPAGRVCDAGIAGSGACVCPLGFTGADCDECAAGYFGASCTSCDACQNGTCIEGKAGECSCLTNFDGDLCDACDPGFYSWDCVACPDCGVGTCRDGFHADGQCDCPTGLQGIGCTACAPGYFGAQCTECSSCGDHGSCVDGSEGDGSCDCDEGWTGAACTSCDTGFAGPTCAPVASMSATQSTLTVTSSTSRAGGAVTVLVTARDFSGTRITSGGHLGMLTASITGSGLDLTPTLVDNTDGTYSVVLSWETAGTFAASVTMEGQGEIGSEQFVVLPGEPSTSRSTYVAPSAAEADEAATITITMRDAFDNVIPNAANDVSVVVGGSLAATIRDDGAGVYTATFTWGTLQSPTVVIRLDDRTLATYSLIITRAPAPVVTSAKFADSGLAVLVALDRATNRGGASSGARADCAALFTSGALSSLGTDPVCVWETDRLLVISMGAGATIEVNDALTFKQDVVQNANANSHDVVTSGVIAAPDTLPTIDVFVNGPSALGSCETLLLDASPTQGVLGRPIQFTWELVDGGSTADGFISAARVSALNERGAVLDLTHLNVATGTYRFRITATQAFLDLTAVTVHSVLVTSDDVTVATDLPLNTYTITTAESLVVVPRVHASKCNTAATLALDIAYQWTLTPPVTGFGATDDAMVRNRFYVAPGELPVGTYTLTLGGTETVGGALDETAATVHVVGQPMSVVLQGAGTRQQVQVGTKVLLNAVNSGDPDDLDVAPAALRFDWTCVSPPGSETPCADGAEGGTLDFTDYRLVPNFDGQLELAETTLASGAAYEFTVTVSEQDGSRAASAWRIVEVVSAAVPTDFDIAGPALVNPDDTVVLTATPGMTSYAWTLDDDSIGFNTCSTTRCPTVAPAGKTGEALVVAPHQLAAGVHYTFTVAFVTAASVSGTASFTVEVNSVPSGGSCSVSPATGVSMETEYRITCEQFVDPHGPLTYQFIRAVDGVDVVVSPATTVASAALLLYEPLDTANAEVKVRVVDTLGAATVHTISSIGVTASQATAGVQLAAAMNRMIDGTSLGRSGEYYAALAAVLAVQANCQACADNVVIALGDQVDGSEPTVEAARSNLATLAGATAVVTSTQTSAFAGLLADQVGVLKGEATAADGLTDVYDATTGTNVLLVSHEVLREVSLATDNEATHLATARTVLDSLGAYLYVSGRAQACGSPPVAHSVSAGADALSTWSHRHCSGQTLVALGPVTLPATFDAAVAERRRANEGAIVEVVESGLNGFPNANNKGGELSSPIVQIRIERDDDVDVTLSNLAGADRISFTLTTYAGPADAGQRECLMLSADYASWEDDKCEVQGDAGPVLAATTTTCLCSKTGTVGVWHTPEEKGTLEKGKDAFLDNIAYIGAGAGALLLLCLCYKRLFCGKNKEGASASTDVDYATNPMEPPRVQMAHRHSQPPIRQSGVPNPYTRNSGHTPSPTAPYGGSSGHPAVQQYQHPNQVHTSGYDVQYQQPGAQHSPYGRQMQQRPPPQQQQRGGYGGATPPAPAYGGRPASDAYGGAATYYNTAVPPMPKPHRPLPPTPPGRR